MTTTTVPKRQSISFKSRLRHLVLFARPFELTTELSPRECTNRLSELVSYSSSKQSLRRITDFPPLSDGVYAIDIRVKHDTGRNAYYTSTMVEGVIFCEQQTVVQGAAYFGGRYFMTITGLVIFVLVMMSITAGEATILILWMLALAFLFMHYVQMVRDRNYIIRLMQEKIEESAEI